MKLTFETTRKSITVEEKDVDSLDLGGTIDTLIKPLLLAMGFPKEAIDECVGKK